MRKTKHCASKRFLLLQKPFSNDILDKNLQKDDAMNWWKSFVEPKLELELIIMLSKVATILSNKILPNLMWPYPSYPHFPLFCFILNYVTTLLRNIFSFNDDFQLSDTRSLPLFSLAVLSNKLHLSSNSFFILRPWDWWHGRTEFWSFQF